MDNEFIKALKERVLVLDGGMGTSIQKYNLTEEDYRGEYFKNCMENQKGNNDLLSLTKPEIIEEIHRSFLEVGADIIETATLNATSVYQKQYSMENMAYDMNYNAAKLAKKVANEYSNMKNKRIFVAGSIGPTNKQASYNPKEYWEVHSDVLFKSYEEQITALINGGVDFLLVETVININNANIALAAAEKVLDEKNIELPIILSATLTKKNSRRICGKSFKEFVSEIESKNLIGIGLNCSFAVEEIIDEITDIATIDNRFIIIYPNAGLPNKNGIYSDTPKEIAQTMKALIDNKIVNIVGGCCGTTPEHIKALVEIVTRR